MGFVGFLALSALGCGDDDDDGGAGAREDGGQTQGKPIITPGKDKDSGSDESEGTVTLGDGGTRVTSCEDAKDGEACGTSGGMLCLDGDCVASRCGDGFVDPALEECDDENTASGDGCSPECAWDCKDDAMCDDDVTCNGKERCLVDHTCALDDPEPDGTACTSATISEGQCRQGNCTPVGCGDKEVKGSEQCDDGNDVAGDGCEIDCTFSCEADADCDDGSLCTGSETCDVAMHKCVAGQALTCADDSECTTDSCDAETGCKFTLIDADGDKHAPSSLPCGDDCDDTRPDVHPGHPELCDDIDHDCTPDTGSEIPTWYADCDGDGYAAVDAPSVMMCDMPFASRDCTGWTSRKPIRDDKTTYDCNDAEDAAYPGQASYFTEYAQGTTSWEYNCSDVVEKLISNAGLGMSSLCSMGFTFPGAPSSGKCLGGSGWVGDKPAPCGKPAPYTQCNTIITRTGTACSRSYYDKTQECH